MRLFTDDDIRKIRDAVQAAERRTRGEIVPMVVPASARYSEARYLAGFTAALLTLTVLLTLDQGWGQYGWQEHHPVWIVFGVVLAYALGYWAGAVPLCVRFFTSTERMAFKVRRRAETAFYEHGLHKTREGTGILIMASLLERRVQVLADKAINERVPPGTWDTLVNDLVEGIRAGQPTEAFCRAIERCGNLLAQHFPARSGDNPDELADDLIQEK
jgi:putative membrane protein